VRAAGRWKILDAFRMQMFAMPDKNDFPGANERGRCWKVGRQNCRYSANYFTVRNFTFNVSGDQKTWKKCVQHSAANLIAYIYRD